MRYTSPSENSFPLWTHLGETEEKRRGDQEPLKRPPQHRLGLAGEVGWHLSDNLSSPEKLLDTAGEDHSRGFEAEGGLTLVVAGIS